MPGVRAASVSWLGLFSMQDLWLPLIDPDRPDDKPMARIDYVSARYFDTMGMQVLRGRDFADGDREGTPRVAVVNETLARARFGAGDPLGRRLALDYQGEQQRPFTVVGVVRDSRVQRSQRQPPQSDDLGSDRAGGNSDLLDFTAHRAGRGGVRGTPRRGGGAGD